MSLPDLTFDVERPDATTVIVSMAVRAPTGPTDAEVEGGAGARQTGLPGLAGPMAGFTPSPGPRDVDSLASVHAYFDSITEFVPDHTTIRTQAFEPTARKLLERLGIHDKLPVSIPIRLQPHG